MDRLIDIQTQWLPGSVGKWEAERQAESPPKKAAFNQPVGIPDPLARSL